MKFYYINIITSIIVDAIMLHSPSWQRLIELHWVFVVSYALF